MEKRRVIKTKGKYYDVGTPNKSFLTLAKDLKTLGIKNWYFMLEIKDLSLIGVNPHAKDSEGNCTLTTDQIDRVIMECKCNPWYFLREVARIADSGASEGVPYKANRGNIAQAWCTLNNLDSWLCLPRQQGKTISALVLLVWIYHFGTTNSTFIYLNKDGDQAKENLRRTGVIIDALPPYMRFKSITDEDGKVTKGKANATAYEHPVNHNKINIKSKATSYDMALSIARGMTAPVHYCDEPEFSPYIDTIVKNAVSTFETAHRRSLANGATSARIFTCTPGDLDTKAGQQAQTLLDSTYRWNDKLYDKTPEEITNILTKAGSNGILYIEYQYYQIGLDNTWLKEISQKIGDPLTVRREILLQRIHGSDLSPYPREDIEYITSTTHQPIDTIFIQEYYQFDIYETLRKDIPYIVGIDCSTGTSSDNNAITILNPYTVKPVAEFKSPYIGETAYEMLIESLVTEYIPRAIICIERNSVGDGIIDHLMNRSRIANNLYFDKDRDLVEQKMREAETVESMLKAKSTVKTHYGVYTNSKSREDMFSILSRRINENKDDFITKNIISDITGLVRTRSGKIEARQGGHDDSIMSYLIALYVYYHGNNLGYFGFYRTDVYDGVEENSGIITKERIRDILPQEYVQIIEDEEMFDKVLNYEDSIREDIIKSQYNSLRQSRSKHFETNNVYDNTSDGVIDDYSNTEDIDLSLFNDLNGF